MIHRTMLHADVGSLLRRSGKRWRGPRILRNGRKARLLLTVLTQIQSVISANAPLAEGLEAAAVDARPGIIRNVLLELRERIMAGNTLADALAGIDRFFPEWCNGLIRAGEEVGRPGDSLGIVIAELRSRADARTTATLTLVYLLILFSCCLNAFYMLQTSIVPLYRDTLVEIAPGTHINKALWFLTEINSQTDTMHDSVLSQFLLVFISPLSMLAGFWILCLLIQAALRKSHTLQLILDTLLAPLPLIGPLRRNTALSSATHALAMQMDSGVPLDVALTQSGACIRGSRVRQAFLTAAEAVRRGESLSDALGHGGKAFSDGFRVAVALGERGGRLADVLKYYSHWFCMRARSHRKILVNLLLPVGVIFMGVLVLLLGYIVFSMLIGLVDAHMVTL